MDSLADEELVDRYRAARDPDRAIPYAAELFQRHHQRVASWCLRMTGDVEAAAELAQGVFAKAFERLSSFPGRVRFSTWLYAIAREHCAAELRARAGHSEDAGDMRTEDADLRLVDVSPGMGPGETEDLYKRLVRDSLDEVETQVMTLHYIHELPLDSVTRVLGLENQNGARSYIVSSRRKLNRALTRWNRRKERIRESDHAGS